MALKGQNLRLFLADKCIAAATSCSFHIGTSLEDNSTKDNAGDWSSQECVGKNWDCSADALVIVETDAQAQEAFEVAALIGTTVAVKLQQTSGEQNRTAVTSGKTLSGNAIVSDISLNAPNKQNATYTVQLTGVGSLSIS